jgi:hypothetical protein
MLSRQWFWFGEWQGAYGWWFGHAKFPHHFQFKQHESKNHILFGKKRLTLPAKHEP